MKINFSCSAAREDANGPIEASLADALAIFRGLDRTDGFLTILLNERQTVQFVPLLDGGVRVELLHHRREFLEACEADDNFAESLIRAAAQPATEVFEVAKETPHSWERSDI